MTFFNIFSNNKEVIEKTDISIDYREKNSLVPSELAKLDFNIKFVHLPIGDYLINDIAIERKTFSDLQSSIINKRIFAQMQELKQYPIHFLIIEGSGDDRFIHENAIRGFIISAQLDYNIPIIFSKDQKDTARYILLLSDRKSRKDTSIRPKKISLDEKMQVQYVLEGFPNIGPVKAKKLMERFGSLKNILSADEKELFLILGKKAGSFIRLIDFQART